MKNRSRTAQPVGTVTADGEILDGVCVVIPAKKQNGFRKGWVAMANDQLGEILNLTISGKLKGSDMQTLFALLEVMEMENWIRVSQKYLSDRLQMRQPHVSRSIKNLIDNGLILIGPKIGTSHTYRLNPRFGWRGSADNHKKALRQQQDQLQQRMKAANIGGVITNRDPNTVDFIEGKTDSEKENK